jgi:signal transduction histidine kinase
MTKETLEQKTDKTNQEANTSIISPSNWRIRVKLLVSFVIVLLVPIIGIIIGTFSTAQADTALRDASMEDEVAGAENQAVTMEYFLAQDQADAFTLSELTSLENLLAATSAGDEDAIDQAKQELSNDFLAFATNNPAFFQVRYLDAAGMEIVRVDSDGETASVITGLQDKSTRPYFIDAMELSAGELYISRLELNVEGGEVQIPYTPVIRYATPVFSPDGQPAGIIITNIFAQGLIDRIASDNGEQDTHILVDEEGFYMKYEGDPSRDWGRDLETAFNLVDDVPELAFVLDAPNADTLTSGDTFYTHTPIVIDAEVNRRWTLITSRPVAEFSQTLGRIPTLLGIIAVITVIVGMTGAYALTGNFTRPISALVATTQRFSGGALTQRTNVTGADELGQLGQAFNEMAGQLEQAFIRTQEQNTALMKGNRDLAVARKRAEDAAKLKSEFLATMSHELRTPLNAVIGYTEIQLAGMTGDLNEEQEDYQKRVLVNAEHLLKLINEVLDLAKIEAGRMDVIKAPFTVSKLLDELTFQTKGLADEKGLELIASLDERLPEKIVGDMARIKQIAINLTSNAIKFTNEGQVKIDIRQQGKDTWALIVSDTGIGIAPHAQEFIFDEFRQADASSLRVQGGTGLGLAIVRKLALTMGGNVRLKSQVDEGSTFTVLLPLVTEETE